MLFTNFICARLLVLPVLDKNFYTKRKNLDWTNDGHISMLPILFIM